MHTRICTQVCRFLEMISKDGMCCLLRPDLCLRWPGWLVPLCVSAHVVLCIPTSPTPSSQHPLCAPLFPAHSLAFLPWLACIVLPSLCTVGFCLFKAGVNKLFFYSKCLDRKYCRLCVLFMSQLLTFAIVAQRQAKIRHQPMTVFQ